MPTIPYKLKDGTRTSGITTLKSQQIGWGKDPLMWWANDQGLKGKTLPEARNTATIPGTVAHYLIECHLREEKPNLAQFPDSAIPKALISYENFTNWCKLVEFEIIKIEPHLVSEKYRLGGTPDLVGWVLGERSIIDWKTGKIYEDVFLQLGFYKEAWEEEHPDQPITGGFHVLRIPKNEDVPSFHHSHWKVLPPEALRAVEIAVELKSIQGVLKKLL